MRFRSVVFAVLALLGIFFGPPGIGFYNLILFVYFPLALMGLAFGVLDLRKADSRRERGVAIMGVLACAAILFGPFLSLFFRKGESRNELAAIADTRTVISAEAAYQSVNSGFYGTLTCLATPSSCIPGYTGPTFLDTSLAGSTHINKQGYTRTWTEKASATGPSRSVDDFCHQSRPSVPGKTGVRSFGGDASGLIGAANSSTDCCDSSGRLLTRTCRPLR